VCLAAFTSNLHKTLSNRIRLARDAIVKRATHVYLFLYISLLLWSVYARARRAHDNNDNICNYGGHVQQSRRIACALYAHTNDDYVLRVQRVIDVDTDGE